MQEAKYSINHVVRLLFKTSSINVASRIFGYLRTFSIAILLGFSLDTDAVFLALSIIGLFILFSESFDTVGVSKLVRLFEQDKEKFKIFVTNLFTLIILLSIINVFFVIILVSILPYVRFIPKEISMYKPFKLSMFIFSLYSALNFIFTFFGSLTRIRKHFVLYFFAEFVFYFFNFVLTTLGLMYIKSYVIIPISFLISLFLATLILMLKNLSYLDFSGLSLNYIKKELKYILNDFISVSSAYGAFYLYTLVDKFFAIHVGEKALSALNYGFLLATSVWNILRFERIAIINLAENLQNYKAFTILLKNYIKMLILISIPFSIIFYALPYYIVKLLFGYGAFSLEDILLTSEALKYYSFSLPFTILWPLVFRAMIVSNLRRAVFVLSIFTILLNIITNYIFVFMLSLGIKGICIATFISYVVLVGGGLSVIIVNGRKEK